MPLRKQPVTVLLQGLNQKAPGTVGVLGQLEVAENVRIGKGSSTSFELIRRNGLVEVADTLGSAFGNVPVRAASYGGGIVVQHDLGGLEQYAPSTGVFSYVSRLVHGAFGLTRSDLQTPLKSASGTQVPTQAWRSVSFIGNRACYVWVDQDGALQYAVRDVGGSPLFAGTTVATGATVSKIVALGTNWYVFWKEANQIRAAVISSTTYAAGAATTVVTAGGGGAFGGTDYDIQTGFDATHIAIMYRSTAGTTHVRALLTTAFAVATTVSDAVAADQPDVAMCWLSQPTFGGSLFYATLNAANGLKLQTIDSATLAITATTTQAGAPVTNVKNMAGGSYLSGAYPVPFAAIDTQAVDGVGVTHRRVTLANAAFTSSPVSGACALASRVAYVGNQPIVAVLYNSTQLAGTPVANQATLLFYALNDVSAVAVKALPGSAGASATFDTTALSRDSSGRLHGLFGRAVSVDTVTGEVVLQYSLSDIGVATEGSTVGAPMTLGSVALFPGGELWEADFTPAYVGVESGSYHEQGFRVKPEIPVLIEGAAASGSIAPGTRSYVVRWKWTDSSGNVYRSATSTPLAITTVNANSSVAVWIYGGNSMASPNRLYPQAEIFRTPMNGTGDLYFRVTPSVFTADAQTLGAVTSFTDTASEATLAAGEPFDASDTAELDNIAPPALNDLVEHKGRAVGISAEQPWRLPFSKQWTPGTSVAFTDAFFLDTPDSTGPVYKVMSMDGHLIAFKRDTIYVFSGDYPAADGTGAPIPEAVQLPVGVGTEQPRSVVLTDLGIIFYSSKRGFWLLNRSLGVDYIGAAVETTAAGQTVSGATVHPTFPEVRFTTEGGTTFVLNTYFTRVAGQPIWTTFTGQPCVHSIVHQGDWYLLTSAGKLLKEDLTRWQDGVALGGGAFTGGTAYTRRVKVADINFAGVGGFGRVYEGTLVGEWYSSEKLKITITDNHRSIDPATGLPAAENPFTYDATTNPDPYQLDFYPAIQKVTAMDVQIEDTADFQGQGSAWTALNFIVGVKGGAFKQGVSHGMSGGARKF
jgi:hypothetical protein